MESLSENIRYRRSEGFVARAIGGETILVPLRQRLGDLESIYTLNAVATFIWERLAAPSTIAEIASALEGEFSGELAEMRQEARAELLAKYTAERNYSALMEIYERAIEGRGVAPEPLAAAAGAAGQGG